MKGGLHRLLRNEEINIGRVILTYIARCLDLYYFSFRPILLVLLTYIGSLSDLYWLYYQGYERDIGLREGRCKYRY